MLKRVLGAKGLGPGLNNSSKIHRVYGEGAKSNFKGVRVGARSQWILCV